MRELSAAGTSPPPAGSAAAAAAQIWEEKLPERVKTLCPQKWLHLVLSRRRSVWRAAGKRRRQPSLVMHGPGDTVLAAAALAAAALAARNNRQMSKSC